MAVLIDDDPASSNNQPGKIGRTGRHSRQGLRAQYLDQN